MGKDVVTSVRMPELYHKFWKNMAANKGLSFSQFLQVCIIEKVIDNIKKVSANMALIETAINKGGVPFDKAKNLTKLSEAMELVKNKAKFKDDYQQCFEATLKKELEAAGIEDLQTELRKIDKYCTLEEWEEVMPPPKGGYQVIDLRKKKA